MSTRMCTMSSNGQQPFLNPLFVNVMCKQHTSEKGLCSECEFDFLVLNRPSVPALKAHYNVLHFALLTLSCSLQDLVTTIKTPVLCLVVLRLAVVFLEEVWKTIQGNP